VTSPLAPSADVVNLAIGSVWDSGKIGIADTGIFPDQKSAADALSKVAGGAHGE
jgi:hypothetical protein